MKYGIFLWVLLLGKLGTQAQISFTTKASAQKIYKNDLLEVSYEVENGSLENLTAPAFTGWQLVSGPNMSSSTTTINGHTNSRMAYQYVLKPTAAGKLTLPGASATINGAVKVSNPLIITVEAANGPGGGSTNTTNGLADLFGPTDALPDPGPAEDDYDGYLLKAGEDPQKKIAENLFLLVNVSKQSCFDGEPLVADYKLYSRVSLNASVTKRPSFSGFGSVDMKNVSNTEYEIARIKGKLYKVYAVRRVQLFPLQTGIQTLEPVEIEATVQLRKVPSYKTMDAYDPYSPDNYVTIPYTVKSEPIKIEVLPLPDKNKPAGFSGAVGRFSLSAKMKEPQLAKAQAGTLTIEITGLGNWAMVQPPQIKWPPGVEVFEPTVIENLDSQAIPVTGTRIYQYSFSSAVPGKLQLSPVNLPFFDPWKKTYATAVTQPVSVEILNVSLPATTLVGPANDDDYTALFTDIITIIAPLAALGLLAFLALRQRKRRAKFFEQQAWPIATDELFHAAATKYSGMGKPTASNPESNPFLSTTTLTTSTPPIVVYNDDLKPVESAPEPDLRSYLIEAKKELLYQMQYKWLLKPGGNLLQQLLDKGMPNDKAEWIAGLLLDIDDQLYNPLAEAIDITAFEDRITTGLGYLKK